MREVTIQKKDSSFMKVNVLSVDEYLRNEENIIELKKHFHKKKGWTDGGRPVYFLNVPVSFDIETSHYDIDDDKKQRVSFMYIWQMCINGTVVMGRTWENWIKLLRALTKKLRLYERKRLIIFVQNLPYEYQFFHKRLPIKSVFAREARKVITVKLDNWAEGIEFRCTYSISGYSLDKIAENTLSCPIKKMKGDLDYDVFRTKKTILTDEEMVYCVNDVLILHYYIKDLIDKEFTKCVSEIPITKTGFVRREARNVFGRDKEYHKYYLNQKLDAHQFVMYNKAYRGGDTHANAMWCGENLNNVYSFDLTSSYPYRILAERFPLSKPITIGEPDIEHLNYLIENDKLFIIDITLCDVKFKGQGYFTYIPISKCMGLKNPKKENGRIVSAECLRICLTSLDFEIIMNNYEFNIVEINDIVYHDKSGLLPKSMRNYVIKLYQDKTTLKGVEGMETEYMRGKENLNSVYGMCVTNPLNDEISYDEMELKWVKKELPITYENEEIISKELQKAYSSRNHFLAYECGVWISAYARYDLHRALSKLGSDAVYWDTDSCKFINKENYSVFVELNREKEKYLLSLGYTLDEIAPKNKKGSRKMIGLWDEEYPNGVKFKTFGAKKYFTQDNVTKENHITVAGLGKQKATEYITKMVGGYIEDNKSFSGEFVKKFDIGLQIDEENSGRTFSIFSDDGFLLNINGEYISEKSYISIVPTTYLLGDDVDHQMFIRICKGIKTIERGVC